MFAGFGVNYKSLQANWPTDIEYFKRIGLGSIRPSLGTLHPYDNYIVPNADTSVGTHEYWRLCARTFHDAGFWVTWGPSGPHNVATGALTADIFDDYAEAVKIDYAYMRANGWNIGCYELGNEMESKIDGTTLPLSLLITKIKLLATQIKADYPDAVLGYGTWNAAGTFFDQWIAAGLGDLDLLGIHVYGQVEANGKGSILNDHVLLAKMQKAFGSRCIITEFGVDANATQYNLAPQYNREYCMRHLYAGIRELGYERAIAYSYVGNLNANNDFALKNTDGTFDVQWGIFLTDGGRIPQVTIGGVTLPVEEARTVVALRDEAIPRTERAETEMPVYFRAKGLYQRNNVQPVDQTPLKIGAASDFSVIIDCVPYKKTQSGNTSSHTIARLDYNNATNQGYLVQLGASDGRVRLWHGTTVSSSPVDTIAYYVRQRIGVTITGTTMRVYINGLLAQTLTVSRVADSGTNFAWLLHEGNTVGSSGGFYGKVFRVLTTKSLLSPEQMAAFETGVVPPCDLYYVFDRGEGRLVRDRSGNNNHGYIFTESWDNATDNPL